jgi:bacillopeptidase F (M6 metalloprotease family)
MLSAKMNLLMKRLDERDREKEVMHIHDSHMTYEECGYTGHSGSNCPELQEDVNYLNNNYYYRPQQNQGWNQQQRPNYSGNYSDNYEGNNSFNQPPLRELVLNQGKLMDS